MPKFMEDAILDAMLDAAEGSTIHVCSAQPANYAGISAVELATGTVGAPTAAAGDVSGRKNTYPAVTGMTINADGTATEIAVSDGVGTLYFVTTCTPQGLTAGGGATVDTSAFDHELQAPA